MPNNKDLKDRQQLMSQLALLAICNHQSLVASCCQPPRCRAPVLLCKALPAATHHTAHVDLDGSCVGVQCHLALACSAGGQAQTVPQLILTNCNNESQTPERRTGMQA